VIGVHVADDDGVELVGMAVLQQLGDDPRPDVDQEPSPAALDEVAGAGLAGVRARGRSAEHGEPHRSGCLVRIDADPGSRHWRCSIET
jgi:hypothetical protein